MSVVHLPELAPSEEPSMSPDGRWAWDGDRWRPLFTAQQQPAVRGISYLRIALLTVAMSFVGCLGAVYMWEIVVLANLRGHLGIPG